MKEESGQVAVNRDFDLAKRITHWLLFVVTIVYLLSGLGITQFRTVEFLTFGLLSKSLAFKIHDSLLIPFVVLLILHVILTLASKRTHGMRAP